MEIEVEGGRPEDPRVYRISSKSYGDKSRTTKHRSHSPNPNGSAEKSRRAVSKPKIFRLLRSKGGLSEYKAKLKQFLTGIIDRNDFCSFLLSTLTKSEIKYHNKFILGVIRNERQRSSEDEKRRSEHRSKTEHRGEKHKEGSLEGVTKDRDGFAVPPPIAKKKKHKSRRDDDSRRRNREGENVYSSAQGSTDPVEPGISSALSQYLQGLDASTLEHLVRETSMISQLLQAPSSSSPPDSFSEEHRAQSPQSAISQTCAVPQTTDSLKFCPNETANFQGAVASGVTHVSALAAQQPAQQRSQCSDGGAYFPHYEVPEITRQRHDCQFQEASDDAREDQADFNRSYLASGHPQSSFQSGEGNSRPDFPPPFVQGYPEDNTAAAPIHQPLPEAEEEHEKTTDSPDPNLWWHSMVDPTVFQRGYQVLNAPEDQVSSYERSTMWAQQFLQSNEHDNDYIYTSTA